jgi:hypothetical protein
VCGRCLSRRGGAITTTWNIGCPSPMNRYNKAQSLLGPSRNMETFFVQSKLRLRPASTVQSLHSYFTNVTNMTALREWHRYSCNHRLCSLRDRTASPHSYTCSFLMSTGIIFRATVTPTKRARHHVISILKSPEPASRPYP